MVLDRLADVAHPQGYDLCGDHAGRTEAPRGWALADRRPPEDLVPPPVHDERDLGGEATVAVLAAALRSVPTPERPAGSEDVALRGPSEAVEGHAGDTAEVPVDDGPPPPPIALLDESDAAVTDTVEIAVPRQVPAARDRHR